LSHPAGRRDGRNTVRTAKETLTSRPKETLTSRRNRLRRADVSGAAARRLLDGSDEGPSALPQLLAAAAAPATDAELQGEAAARGAFRSSVQADRLPLRNPRRTRARAATAIVTTKIIAAIALPAGTAGGVAHATKSYTAHPQEAPAVRGTETATFGSLSPSGITAVPSAQAPDDSSRSDSVTETGEAAGDGTVSSPGIEAGARGPLWRCDARCT
jgi:hypothetical protein